MAARKQEPPVIDVEVVTEDEPRSGGRPGRGVSAPPVHPLSATLLLVVDGLWNFADWSVASWFLTIPASFATVFVPTLLVQRHVKGDPPFRAFRLALLLGALAAVPTSIFSTPAGLAFLTWSGLNKLFGHTISKAPRQ